MYRSFGTALDEFGSSIDIADGNVLAELNGLLNTYLREEMKFDFYEVLVERWVGTKDGPERALTTLLCEGGRNFDNVPVKDGRINQTAYSFVKDRPLWITTVGEKPLKRRGASYVDTWSRAPLKGLPQYKSGNEFSIKTSIIQPLKNGESAFGVINVESERHRLCNRWARRELELVGRGVGSIVGRVESHKTMRRGTDLSLRQLRDFESRRWNPIGEPSLFVAYSEDANDDVVETLRNVTNQCKDHRAVFWQEHKRGDMRHQMLEWLRESRVIVCYLSEPVEGGRYADNPNVLIEAGIAQGLNSAWRDVELVVIREKDSVAETPFDIAGHDVLTVPRGNRGALQKREFKKLLSERLRLASSDRDR